MEPTQLLTGKVLCGITCVLKTTSSPGFQAHLKASDSTRWYRRLLHFDRAVTGNPRLQSDAQSVASCSGWRRAPQNPNSHDAIPNTILVIHLTATCPMVPIKSYSFGRGITQRITVVVKLSGWSKMHTRKHHDQAHNAANVAGMPVPYGQYHDV